MAKFVYKAKAGPDNIVEGTMEAEGRGEVIDKLQAMGYFPVSVLTEDSLKVEENSDAAALRLKISRRDLLVFTRQLSDLIDSGLPIFKALNLIESQTENIHLRRLVSRLSSEIKEGKKFSSALAKFPEVFSGLFIALVKAGEVGGMLDKVLLRLADYLEREEELKGKVRAALAYPSLMAVVGAATVFILMSFVMPRLVVMFKGIGQNLPLPTLILIGISGFLSRFWWLVLALLAAIFFAIKRRLGTEEGRLLFDRMRLSIPFFGGLIKKSEIARFGRTLSTLLANGVPMLASLDTVMPVVENILIRKEIERIRNDVRDGVSLSKSVARSPLFPAIISNMIAVGEESGNMERSLLKVSESYERETERIIKVVTSLIEPIIILVMGSIVGFIVISMLLPIFQINLVAW